MRKIIIVVAGVLLLIGANFLSNYFSSSKKVPKQKLEKVVKTVFVNEIKNKSIPIHISANGNLVAKNKLELYAEVQGLLENKNNDFRPGVTFKKGQTILKINSDEFYASILSQRSSLESLIASMIPDIRLDYPNSFKNWETYLNRFDVNKPTSILPESLSNQEKLFVTAKGIYTSYYSLKNLEQRLTKYTIKAPFNGIVTETNVTNGALVRSGQSLGEFIDPSIYELELSVNAEFAHFLDIGKTVELKNLSLDKSWLGKVSRINGKIDITSQTIQVFVDVKGKDLQEGMYLEADVSVKEEKNAIEIDRKLLIENKAVFIVRNNVLDLVEIDPVYFKDHTVVIKGLNNGTKLVSKPIPGAYDGMPIQVYSNTNQAVK